MKKKPFKSDGCSGLKPWLLRLFRISWVLPCCEEHDYDYHVGGDRAARRKADIKFRQCIYRKAIKDHGYTDTGAYALCTAFFAGVRPLGSPFIPIKGARWNFGLPYGKYMRALWRGEAKY